MKSDGADRWQTAEVETFAPEDVVSLQLTRCPSVETVVQTQLAEVPEVQVLLLIQSSRHISQSADSSVNTESTDTPVSTCSTAVPLLGGQVLGFDHPQRQDVLQPPAVVLVGVNGSPQVLHPFIAFCR